MSFQTPDGDDAGWFAIDAVDDAGTAPLVRAEVILEVLADRPRATLPRQGHREEPGRLVDGNQVVVFIENDQLARPVR